MQEYQESQPVLSADLRERLERLHSLPGRSMTDLIEYAARIESLWRRLYNTRCLIDYAASIQAQVFADLIYLCWAESYGIHRTPERIQPRPTDDTRT